MRHLLMNTKATNTSAAMAISCLREPHPAKRLHERRAKKLCTTGVPLSVLHRSPGLSKPDIVPSAQGNLVSFSTLSHGSATGQPAAFTTYSLTNPDQPQLIATTSLLRYFIEESTYIGNTAIVPQGLLYYTGIPART
jgi:hypothetical protein